MENCARGRILSGLDGVKAGLAGPTFLESRIKTLRSRASEAFEESEIGLANEVLARALIALGQVDQAVEPLGIASRFAKSRANQLKAGICNVQLLLADGQKPEAEKALDKAIDYADQFSLVHHRQKLADLNLAIQSSTPSTHFHGVWK